MKLTAEDYQDLGHYLQGLLQVMAADNHLHEEQKARIRQFAAKHSFEKGYVERAIQTVLENPHIPRIPPRFHSKHTAQMFLAEAVELALCDGELHPAERQWLSDAALRNGFSADTVDSMLSAH